VTLQVRKESIRPSPGVILVLLGWM
jgi:hypothetical protein